MSAPTVKSRQSPSGPLVPGADLIPGLAQVLQSSPDAATRLIKNLGAPVEPNDGARLADITTLINALLNSIQMGRASVGSPNVGGGALMPLTPIYGFTAVGDRLQVGGPAIVIVQWNCTLLTTDSNVSEIGINTTTLGNNTAKAVVANNRPIDGFSQSVAYPTNNANEEVWLTATTSPSPAIVSNAFIYVTKIPLPAP